MARNSSRTCLPWGEISRCGLKRKECHLLCFVTALPPSAEHTIAPIIRKLVQPTSKILSTKKLGKSRTCDRQRDMRSTRSWKKHTTAPAAPDANRLSLGTCSITTNSALIMDNATPDSDSLRSTHVHDQNSHGYEHDSHLPRTTRHKQDPFADSSDFGSKR